MSGEIEAVGAAATAGLAAGVIEGREPGEVGEGVFIVAIALLGLAG